jgi:hypothetical protein
LSVKTKQPQLPKKPPELFRNKKNFLSPSVPLDACIKEAHTPKGTDEYLAVSKKN